jgi:hypothetical protein
MKSFFNKFIKLILYYLKDNLFSLVLQKALQTAKNENLDKLIKVSLLIQNLNA